MGNILQICHFSAAYKGNFVESMLNLEEYLKQENIQEIYLFPYRSNLTDAKKWITQLQNEGHTIYIQSDSFIQNFKLIREIKIKHNITTVLRHFADNKSDILTKLIFKGKDTVHFFRCRYFANPKSLKHRIRKFLYKDNLLVGVSQSVSDEVKEYFPKNKVITINNAVCFDRLDSPETFEKKNNITCVTMGYNPLVKGLDVALDAVAQLQNRYKITLYIVAASHLDEITDMITQRFNKIPDWISILPPTGNVSTYLSNIDILLAPSRSEGLPNTVIEATYCNSTLVLSDIPSHRLLNVDKRYMFKSEDSDDMAKKLETAINEFNSEESKTIKEKSRRNVIEQYDINEWCKNVRKIIK